MMRPLCTFLQERHAARKRKARCGNGVSRIKLYAMPWLDWELMQGLWMQMSAGLAIQQMVGILVVGKTTLQSNSLEGKLD